MVHGTGGSIYYLHVAKKGSNIKLLYQWEGLNERVFVASPYHNSTSESNDTVNCSQVDITNALKARKPVKAIVKRLKKLKSVGGKGGNRKYKRKDFDWMMHGVPNAFCISNPGESLYWGEIVGVNGQVVMTDNEAIKLELNLVTTMDSP